MDKTRLGIGVLNIIAVGVLFGGIGMMGYTYYSETRAYLRMCKEREKSRMELTLLIEQVKAKSAGDDRIWDAQEKRKFLDAVGVREIIGDAQDVYFRQDNGENMNIVAGYNLENNGRFLIGSSADSGTVIGNVSKRALEAYLKE